ncbi:MAG: SDR family NAD(P)-dependent oxidoreductase [Nanoarchaeota archaeon]|nr:SDR family NAD(P)-dependent oxidoreductase [Nanoarchaeota archaeon]
MNYYQLKRMDSEEVLILGGMGAIGSCIAHTAVDLGANVTIFDNLTENTGANFANIKEIKDKVKFIKGDIRDFNSLKEVVKNKQIIYNCAGQVSHTISMQDPFLDIDINCRGQLNVLESCRRYNDSVKIIHTGSRSQFGAPKVIPLTEECLDYPTDIFSANKLANEFYHKIYYQNYGLKTTSLRLTNTFGPRAQTNNPGYNVVNWLIARAVLKEDLPIFEPGTQLRDINYVQDVVDAMILTSQSNRSDGEVFLVGSNKGISLLDLAKSIVAIAGTGNVKLVPWSAERKKIEVGDILIDYSKINKILGWYPKTSVEDGIRKTISFYRERFSEYFKVV